LGKQVFAIEVVVDYNLLVAVVKWFMAVVRRVLRWEARPYVAAPDPEAKMLGRDVTFPFILGAKRRGATVDPECAAERPGVSRQNMFS